MRVAIEPVQRAAGRRARELGFGGRDAALLADHFVDAELRGASTHGLERLRWLAGFRDLDPTARVRVVERGNGAARYDATGAVGYLALAEAIDRELADPPPDARLVVVSNCFPTGRLGYFAERAAANGLLCLLCATSTARIAHPEGGPPVVGTNPFCLALPDGDPPVVVDVSMGRTTYGQVLTAAARGERLPTGTAARQDGSAEADAREVIADRAAIRPFGGEQAHKGFALAAIVELLCGALAGTDGHSAVALLARPQAEAAQRLRGLLDGRRMPGDASFARRAAALELGQLDVADDLWRWLEGSSAGGPDRR
jgi:LDH2 family malate/lactate/ureidoglycolate dehydrogenase